MRLAAFAILSCGNAGDASCESKRAGIWQGSVVDALAMIKERWFLRAALGLAACLILFGEGASISDRVSVDTFAVMERQLPSIKQDHTL